MSFRLFIATLAGLLVLTVLSRLAIFDGWWCLDDWGQLGRSISLEHRPDRLPARWISQHLWWDLATGICGTSFYCHTVLRLAIHALNTLLVVSIAIRIGARRPQALAAGALFAATPTAFTPLFWASGIQELLAACFALLSIYFWRGASRSAVIASCVFGACSIASKEAGFAIVPLYAILILRDRTGTDRLRTARLIALAMLMIAALVESRLILSHFDTSADSNYRIAPLLLAIGNLGVFGRWITTASPTFESNTTWTYASLGLLVWVGWLTTGIVFLKRGRPIILFCVIFAAASVGPALLLASQARPYMGYLASAAFAISIIACIRRVPRYELSVIWILIAGCAALSFYNTSARISARTLPDRADDPIVRASETSRRAAANLMASKGEIESESLDDLVVYQPPIRPADFERIAREGILNITPTERYKALGAGIGPAYVLGLPRPVSWVGDLSHLDSNIGALCATRSGFTYIGKGAEAQLYAAIVHMVVGRHDQACELLTIASADYETSGVIEIRRYRLPVSHQSSITAVRAFRNWLQQQLQLQQPPATVEKLQSAASVAARIHL